MNWFRKLFAPLLAALALTGCATDIYAPREDRVAPALWKVADRDTTIYLFGTIHALTADTGWFAGPIEAAYNASDELVTEISVENPVADAQAIAARALLPQGQNLREMMKPDARARFEDALVSLGLPVTAMDRYRPWYVAMLLTMRQVGRQGFTAQSGVETTLAGRSEDKKRSALETVEDQVDVFDNLPVEAQLTLLEETIRSMDIASDTLRVMVDRWLAGDAAGLAELMNNELTDPVLHARLLTDRNARWAEWLDQRMKEPGTVFVAVGAGHLAGRGSVQDHLQRRGYRVQRVTK
jgi:uncharacterized protein